jgi:hypothetical protein
VKPLLRSVSFPQSCYVLALAQKSVRLVEVSPDLPSTAIHIEGMPEDAGRAIQGAGEASDWPRSPRPRFRASVGGRGAGGYRPRGRSQDAEGQKVLLRQFARQVDKALRPVVTGSGLPLVLASAEPLASTYRSVNSYPQLAAATIEGNPEAMTEAQLGERARAVLDGIYRDELTAWRTLFEARAGLEIFAKLATVHARSRSLHPPTSRHHLRGPRPGARERPAVSDVAKGPNAYL